MRLTAGATNPLTAQQVKDIWPALDCWHCHSRTGGVHWDQHCQQALCGDCRRKRRRVLAQLTVQQRIERSLGLQGLVVPGTYYPQGD